MARYIERILIANRGEIARRIIRTAHSMGISAVAIYADGDAREPFVKEADVAIALDGASSLETYLDIDKVIAAAKRADADAVHPGYGFLAENARFARSVVNAGLTWIGPPPEAIARMGDKLSSKRLIAGADVPFLPAAEVAADADPVKLAAEIGYPLLVKASAGGGGKGMRVVEAQAGLAAAVEGARREAATAFGDDTLFLERWLPSTRHVEIQVLGDEHGNVVHCFERECSIQRRHQKIIEEAPSPALTQEMRERMGAAAVAAAKAIGYTSAGTVEFLVDGEGFWFLEMNTRLQVEHPVTEEITGLDLVREQILVAQGEPLGFTQEDLVIDGHAIEARLYGEDPANGFLPTSGEVLLWEPSRVAQARYDSGIETGSRIGIEFDPMVAKVIAHAPTRREAALRLARVLETTRIQGLVTNRDFLVSVLRHPAFLAGGTTTDFIERIDPPRGNAIAREDVVLAAIAAALLAQVKRREKARVLRTIPSGWRNSLMPPERVGFAHLGEAFTLEYRSRRDGSFWARAYELEHDVRIDSCSGKEIALVVDGLRLQYTATSIDDRWIVHGPAGQLELTELPRFPDRDREGLAGGLTAPMPGSVISIHVEAGAEVERGQLLLIMEGMKMQHRIVAPLDGVVADIKVHVGDQVSNGQLLIVLNERKDEA